jgi:hypothetical protein
MISRGVFGKSVSKSETQFFDTLESILHRLVERQVFFNGRVFDGRIGNLLIEVDSDYWHRNAQKVDKLKNKIAAKNKLFLLRVTVNSINEAQEIANEYSNIVEFIV